MSFITTNFQVILFKKIYRSCDDKLFQTTTSCKKKNNNKSMSVITTNLNGDLLRGFKGFCTEKLFQ